MAVTRLGAGGRACGRLGMIWGRGLGAGRGNGDVVVEVVPAAGR